MPVRKEKRMKKTAGSVLAAAAVLGLLITAFAVSDYTMTPRQAETLKILGILCGMSAVFCFTVGEMAQNFSQMDKLWSLLPIAYTWIVAARGGMKLRLVVFALIVTAWGIRLTINFARKGAYRLKFWDGEEDYRWSIVRRNPIFRKRFAWTLFDLFFISIYQNALVLAICLPAAACMESTAAIGPWDLAALVAAVLFLTLETAADESQWRFYRKRKELTVGGRKLEEIPAPYCLGFNTTGPWNRMRHPNYLGEQGIWLSLYLFTAGAGVCRAGIFHWSMAGALLLVFLFMGSSSLGEKISGGKYPRYREYVEKVWKYVPAHKFRN